MFIINCIRFRQKSVSGQLNLTRIDHRNNGLNVKMYVQMSALKNLGLNVVKANVVLDSSGRHNTFSITKA